MVISSVKSFPDEKTFLRRLKINNWVIPVANPKAAKKSDHPLLSLLILCSQCI